MLYRAFALCLLAPALFAQAPTEREIRAALDRAIPMVQSATAGFYKTQDCFSCHNYALPMKAFQMARSRGIALDEAVLQQVATKGLSRLPDLISLDRAVQDVMIIDTVAADGWALEAARAAGIPRTAVTAVYARRLANWQESDGHFNTSDVRPPQSHSLFTATAVAAQAMRRWMPQQLQQEAAERLARAKAWLLTAQPLETEDYTYRLLGLLETGATPAEYAKAARELAMLQRADGGWGQLPHMPSDAYATGEALFALRESGAISLTDPAWRKGIRYLLSTQDTHGVWHVHTRMTSPAPVSPPYLESGFPYGHDQFVSMDGACWSILALLETLPKVAKPASPLPLPAFAAKDVKPWMTTALFGSTAELKALLDGGLDVNSHTAEGTTLLMMTAQDPEKVKLLLARGAEANAKAKTGFTALMVAATYRGTAESMKTLLARGAEANPGKGVLFNASPLMLAAMASDAENVRLLLAYGADANRKMVILGMFPTSPLMGVLGFGNVDVINALLKGGANLRERDSQQMTPLHWAALADRPALVRTLIAAGADVNAVDSHGYTPLLYAATVDFGHPETARLLLQNGANPNVKAKDGKTAMQNAAGIPYLRAALPR